MPDSYADVVRSLLTPTPPATPAEGLTRLDQPLDRGVPQRLRLDTEHEVAVLVPTGVAIDWRDADPAEPVSAAVTDRAPRPARERDPIGTLRRPPARLAVLDRGAVVGVLPLVAGGPRPVGRLEIQVLDWDLRAGALRGPGDGISSLALAWRRTDVAVSSFSTPPVPPSLAFRLPDGAVLQSVIVRDPSSGLPWTRL